MTNTLGQFFLATIVGQIFDTYGPRILLVVGTILIGLSLILTSVLTEYYQLMITHGVIFGIGSAMLYTPSVSGEFAYFTGAM
jgi:MFS family permease